MPDITLYENDIHLIRDALTKYKLILRRDASKRVVSEAAYNEIAELERLHNLLLDRLTQQLHPKRE